MKTTTKIRECAICRRNRSPGSIDHAGDYVCMVCTDECEGYAVRAVYLAFNELTEEEGVRCKGLYVKGIF